MTKLNVSIEESAKQWLDNGWDDTRIVNELLNIGIDERNHADFLAEIKKMRHARNTTIGLYYVLAGAIFCLLSCVLTLSLSTDNTNMVLFGLTSVGVIIVFIGLVKIFG